MYHERDRSFDRNEEKGHITHKRKEKEGKGGGRIIDFKFKMILTRNTMKSYIEQRIKYMCIKWRKYVCM